MLTAASLQVTSQMGNSIPFFTDNSIIHSPTRCQDVNLKFDMNDEFVPVNKFEFMEPFEEDSTNGLCFSNIYLPEEIVADILSYMPPKNLLKLTQVCKKWCNIIKSENFWMNIYNKRHPTKAKKLPWYVFYCYFTTNNFENLLKNGNGQEQFKHWKIIKNFGDEFRIENPPCGSDPLPTGVPEFNGHTSCFSTSFYECNKIQEILIADKRLLRYILNKFMPHIYVSEWVAGRFDCGCMYKLVFKGYHQDYNARLESFIDGEEEGSLRPLFYLTSTTVIEQWQGRRWEKVELLLQEYPQDIAVLIFEHEGHDTQFWKGHYGSKMAGGVVRIVFDSIQPLPDATETSRGPENSETNT